MIKGSTSNMTVSQNNVQLTNVKTISLRKQHPKHEIMRNHAIKEVECNKSIPFQLVPPEVSIKRRRPRSHSI